MAILLLVAIPPPGHAGQSGQGPRLAVTESQGRSPDVLLRHLPGLRHAFAMVRLDLAAFFGDLGRAERMLGSENERDAALQEYPQAVARWAEFGRLVNAVVGGPAEPQHLAYRDALAAFVADGPVPIPADADAVARDRVVLAMAMAGYGAKLIADVVSGRLAIEVVQQATKRRLLGHTDAEIARYLEAHIAARAAAPRRRAAQTTVSSRASAESAPPGIRVDRAMRDRFDHAVVRHARHYGVDPDLVRAVITHESAWNSGARSHKGAIGLMQLMPDTARVLGVNPFDPDQNIAGGIRYLADLRTLFDGNLDAMIVAYVAGPTYAQRWLRGTTVLDDEVRAYLENVKTSYRRPSASRRD